jgi:hypothetical protein
MCSHLALLCMVLSLGVSLSTNLRRFYPVAFTVKMKTQLERCHQGKKTVVEYEVEFNQIVRFVPHVAHNEYEKARIFHQGLKASI